jgi:phosphocarrier protein
MTAVSAARRTVEIVNARGLHARASAKFVKAAAQFDAEVKVSREGQTVDAQSIMGLMMLGAGPGSEIEIIAEGPEADAAVDGLAQLVADRFDEDH